MSRMIYLGNNSPKLYLPGQLGVDPVLADDQTPFTTETSIQVSPDSSLLQAVAEIRGIWALHAHQDNPSYVSCSEDLQVLASVLCDEFGGIQFNGVRA